MKMTTRRILFPLLALILTSAACNISGAGTSPTSQPDPAIETPIPATAIPTLLPDLVTKTPIAASTDIAALTLDQLKNADVNIIGVSGTSAARTVRLTNGKFESNSDHTSTDYVNVNMGAQVAYGDLNGDGAQDAAIIIGENYGGTGDFVSVVAMLNQNGQPTFGGSFGVDDRPQINSIVIQNGEILLDATIHGPNDPGCCPAQPVSETLRLWGGKLIQTHHTSKIPDGTERIIQIDSPAQGSEISGPFTINGSVTIAPFENNLAYSIFIEGTPDPVMQSSILVNATDMGGPGTFALPLDLTTSGAKGNIRIEISDVSAADGSYLAVATLFITIK